MSIGLLQVGYKYKTGCRANRHGNPGAVVIMVYVVNWASVLVSLRRLKIFRIGVVRWSIPVEVRFPGLEPRVECFQRDRLAFVSFLSLCADSEYPEARRRMVFRRGCTGALLFSCFRQADWVSMAWRIGQRSSRVTKVRNVGPGGQ